MRILGGTVSFALAYAFALQMSMAAHAASQLPPTQTTTKAGATNTGVSGLPIQKFEVIQTIGGVVQMNAICGKPGLSSCELVMPTLRKSIFGQVKKHIDAAYLGKLLDPSTGKKGGTGFLTDQFLQVPICNLKDKVYKDEAGNAKANHLPNSDCGKACKFSCSPIGGSVSCKMESTSDGTCGKERALTRGALVQYIWHEYDNIVTELSKPDGGHRLELSENCQGVVSDPKTKKVFLEASNEIQRYLKVNGGREVSCPVPGEAVSAEVARNSQIEQAGCYLKSSRATLEMLIGTVATCEVFSRAWKNFQNEMVSFKQIPDLTIQEARKSPDCVSKDTNAAAFQGCINTYYESHIADAFMKQMESFGNAPIEAPSTTAK